MHGRFDGALNYLPLSTSTGQARRHDQVRHRDKQQQQLHYQNREEEEEREEEKEEEEGKKDSSVFGFGNARHSRLLMLGGNETKRKRREWRREEREAKIRRIRKTREIFKGTQSAHSTPSKIQMDCIIIPRLGSLVRTLDPFSPFLLLIAQRQSKRKKRKRSERPEEEEMAMVEQQPGPDHLAPLLCAHHTDSIFSPLSHTKRELKRQKKK